MMRFAPPPRLLTGAVLLVAAMLVASCTGGGDAIAVGTPTSVEPATTVDAPEEPTTTDTSDTEPIPVERPLANPATVLAVSDLTDCRGPDLEVAELVRSLEGTVLMAGDLAYGEGTQQQFDDCFLPLYGSELDRIYASPGDNDYKTPGAAPYYATMSGQPGEAGKGWYAAEIGSWQLVSLNSNCGEVGGCREGSEQYEWLEDLLDAKQYDCRIVMWHQPRFTSSANYSGLPRMGDFYSLLHEAGAEILIVGNSHHYERLGPLLPSGEPGSGGLMNFTIGTGGASLTEFGEPLPGSQIRNNDSRGLVQFTLGDGGYDWEFINVESNETELVDAGSVDC